jgi:sec-independent protein translocase protein TatC
MQSDPELEKEYNYGLQLETPFLDQLERFRRSLFKVLIVFVLTFILSAILVHNYAVTDILLRPIAPFLPGGRLAAFSPITPFLLELKVAVMLAVSMSLPVVLYQLWHLIKPRFDADQQRMLLIGLWCGGILFAAGVSLAYAILPLALRLFFTFQAEYLTLVIEANEYVGFVVTMFLAFGGMFQLPVVVMILTMMGIVTPSFLREKRRHAIAITVVAVSFIIPGDIQSSILAMVPMFFLYEMSIFVSAFILRREKRLDAQRDAERAEEERLEAARRVDAPPARPDPAPSEDPGYDEPSGDDPVQDDLIEEHP